MSRIRILFLGTPDFAVYALESLLKDEHFEVVGVVTQPDRPAGRNMKLSPSPVKEIALKNNLKLFTPQTVNTEEFRQEMLALKAESAVVVAFGQILGQKFLDLFPLGCVNIHASLLPKWRGAAPIQRSIMAGDSETGVALQKIVLKLDAGDVLGIRKIEITEDMNAIELYEALKKLGSELLNMEYMDYLRGNITGIVQDESQVSIAPKIAKSEAGIDWSQTAFQVSCLIRGLAMGPIPFAMRLESKDNSESVLKMLKIHRVKVQTLRAKNQYAPGTIIDLSPKSFTVACGQDALEVFEVQPESKSRMKVEDYLRGYPLKKGDILKNGKVDTKSI